MLDPSGRGKELEETGNKHGLTKLKVVLKPIKGQNAVKLAFMWKQGNTTYYKIERYSISLNSLDSAIFQVRSRINQVIRELNLVGEIL